TIYPVQCCCINPVCEHAMRQLLLKKEQQRCAVVFTVADGACLAWSVHLYCTECKTNYHNNYSVCGGVQTYFGGVPDLIQVGEHQLIKTALINTWVDLMLTAW
ncbi:hypothetical protein PILCRDRAFT_81590, partial [Piloderma croceum F 1598]